MRVISGSSMNAPSERSIILIKRCFRVRGNLTALYKQQVIKNTLTYISANRTVSGIVVYHKNTTLQTIYTCACAPVNPPHNYIADDIKAYTPIAHASCSFASYVYLSLSLCLCLSLSPSVCLCLKLQALLYDILPSTTAVFSYAIGSRKLSANEQFFAGAQTVVSLLHTTQIKQGVSFIAVNKVYTSANKTTIV